MSFLVTGSAGFIGFTLARKLLERGHHVVGLDNLNDYYDVELKKRRLAILTASKGFEFSHLDISDRSAVPSLFAKQKFKKVIHLAAQAGVRYSLTNPHAYVDSNLTGFLNILEGCRHQNTPHLIYASTSSVYGLNEKMPFSVHDGVDHPASLYAATKRANELMAHSYSHLYRLPTTGLRFFTVYGPWGRPDMALFLFTKNILAGMPIDLFNKGQHMRDFTFVDDIVEGLVRVVEGAAPVGAGTVTDPASSTAPYRLYNIGNNNPVELSRYIEVLEECLGKKALKNYLPMQPGDILATSADVSDLQRDFDYKPATTVEAGVRQFVAWYRDYYRV